MKRYAILIVSALVATVGACGRDEPGAVERLVDVGSISVSAADAAGSGSQVPARIVARQTANLATRASGTVESVHVTVGAAVRRGQLLVRLEASSVEAAVARAEAQSLVARRTHERISNLERDGAATRQELDQAEAALRTAEAMLAEALAAREYVALRAPFDGTVTARLADPGDLAVPGRPVLVVSGSQGVKIEADLPAPLADAVAEGDLVYIVRPGTGDRWTARVTRVVPVIELSSHRFRVEASFQAMGGVPAPGTFARLEIPGRGEESAWIPSDALVRRGQLAGVYVLSEGALRLRWVRTGRRTGDAVEILAGLQEGELVVRDPSPALSDGSTVGGWETVAWAIRPDGAR
jgi:RND family efflux transporter MFP subunit